MRSLKPQDVNFQVEPTAGINGMMQHVPSGLGRLTLRPCHAARGSALQITMVIGAYWSFPVLFGFIATVVICSDG